VALRGERNRNIIGMTISLATQRHATQRAAVMEIRLNNGATNPNPNVDPNG